MPTKRHAFWRGPNGLPIRDSYDTQSPSHLLQRLATSTSTSTSGETLWSKLDLLFDPAILRGRLFIDTAGGRDLSDNDLEDMALKAAKAAVRVANGTRTLPSESFLKALDSKVSDFLSKQPIEYILHTTLSATELPSRSLTLAGCRITARKRRSNRHPRPVLQDHFAGTSYCDHEDATAYMRISIRTHGRSVYEAAEIALDSLTLLRALWTFHSSFRQKHHRFVLLQAEPFSHVHSGPIHILYLPSGARATDTVWYEPYYASDEKVVKPGMGWASLKRFVRRAQRLLRTSPFRNDLERTFRRYIVALDKRDPETTFVNLWSVLELITQSGDEYEKTVRRASWLFSDRDRAREELRYLRLRRNRIVHASAFSQDGASSVSQLKSVIDAHLRAMLYNPCKAKSLSEYAMLLDLPTDETESRARHAALSKAKLLYSTCAIASS